MLQRKFAAANFLMKLSTRSTYGMRALVELALTAGHGPVSTTLIAKRQALSVAYLEQLLHRLKRHGLVSSVRGPRGGYVLAKHPCEITMAEIVGTLDGAVDPQIHRRSLVTDPVDRSNGRVRRPLAGRLGRAHPLQSVHMQRHAQQVAQTVWRCVHERLAESLGAVTLQDLCEEVRAELGEPLEHRYVFPI